MDPDISEFSYGYALTETLISAVPFSIRAAPIFPSLIDEGRVGGGYDVQLPFAGVPLFLQFKLSHKMVRYKAFEASSGIMGLPFYRMHLRPTMHSQQHPMLLDLESTGALVYYAAPLFDTPAELNEVYINRQVVQRSVFFKPSEIGQLPDERKHHIAFREGFPAYLCSEEPRMIREEGADLRVLLNDLTEGYWDYEKIHPDTESISLWIEKMIKIIERYRWSFRWYSEHTANVLRDRLPLNTLAYLARTFFGCTVIVVAPDEDDDRDLTEQQIVF